jgi:DNA-binding IscR family transcriptional regulator
MLSKPAENITVGDVLRSLEGTLCPVECIDIGMNTGCNQIDKCITAPVWVKLRDKINEVVDSITVADLVKNYEK